jgi:hypothetical protein
MWPNLANQIVKLTTLINLLVASKNVISSLGFGVSLVCQEPRAKW